MLALCHQLGYQPDERGFDETFAQVVRHPEAAVFVAVLGAKTLGYLALSYRPQIRLGGRAASIDELVVAADQRGGGIGSSLLQTALDHARSIGCRRVELQTNRARESYTRQFYVERGFTEVDSALLRLEWQK